MVRVARLHRSMKDRVHRVGRFRFLKGGAFVGTFNKVHAAVVCPRCGAEGVAELELRLGNTANMRDLRVGDLYPWVPGEPPENGGRPEGGNVDGDGYMECEHCRKDSFHFVTIREDVINGIAPNRYKEPYITD